MDIFYIMVELKCMEFPNNAQCVLSSDISSATVAIYLDPGDGCFISELKSCYLECRNT